MKVPKPLVVGSSVAAGVALGRKLVPGHPLASAAVGALVGLLLSRSATQVIERSDAGPSPSPERPFTK